MTVTKFIEQIDKAAQSVKAADSGVTDEEAVVKALALVIRRSQEPPEAHEQRILDALRKIGGKGPVTTIRLGVELNIPRSTLSAYLRDLEGRFLVPRPNGPKSGWAIVDD